jgi:hypothetical protein
LILFHINVPNNTTKNITIPFQIVLNGGVFLRKKTTAIPPQNKTLTTMSVDVTVGGYDSNNFMI